MRSLESWLSEYSESHQNRTNQILHRICVPAIFFSILGILWVVKFGVLNLALIITFLVVPFYVQLGLKAVGIILPQLLVSLGILIYFEEHTNSQMVFITCLVLFIVAWIGQFIGHHLEGKKPSFFKDLQFLLIGPLWIFKK